MADDRLGLHRPRGIVTHAPALLDPLILTRAAHFAATMLIFGIVLFRAFVAWPEGLRTAFMRTAAAALALALMSGPAWVTLIAASNGDDGAVWSLVTQTRFGRVMLARALIALVIVALAPRLARPHADAVDWLLVALCAVFAGSLALTGHSGALGPYETLSDALHILAAGGWVGALAPLIAALAVNPDTTIVARRFSILGLVCVATLTFTGICNAYALAGGLPGLIGTPWGLLLGAKLALVGAMLGLAAGNRLYLTPRLTRAPSAVTALRASALAELALGCIVIIVAARVGATLPGAHAAPDWPLTWRFDASAFGAEPEIANAAWRAASMAIAGAGLAFVALPWRRARTALFTGAAVALAIAAFSAPGLTTPAFPTTFQTSPFAFSARTIAMGADAFALHCAQCHGVRGKGDAPRSATLAPRPADLTGDHLFVHPDGDLFWWIAYGLGPMPGYAAALDPATLWSLVDFLHANADGARLAALGGRVAGAAFPLPEFAMRCAGRALTSTELAGSALHIVVSGAANDARLRQLSFLAASSDVTTVIVRAGASLEDGAWRPCIAGDDDLLQALAVYRRVAPNQLEGSEFLVDGRGQLRSMWHADAATDWRDPLAFRRALAEMKVPQELARALSAVNSAPGGPAVGLDARGHGH